MNHPAPKTNKVQIHVAALGGLSIRTGNDTEISFPTKKCRALLIYLVMARGKPRSREHLAGLLWGRSADEQARASLRQTLAALRKAFANTDALLSAGTDNVYLLENAVTADVIELEQCCEQATTESLRRAVNLYKGEFLEGFSLRGENFDEWVSQERNRLQRLIVGGMQDLLAREEKLAATEATIQLAHKLLSIDPLQESTYRALMRLYHRSGKREKALEQYETCRKLLFDELNVEPDTTTRSLHQEILAENPESGVAAKTAATPIQQDIRFCTATDGTRICYAISGSGPPMVKAANWLSHLEYDSRSPVWRHWLDELSANNTLYRYDARGCGLSDWNVDEILFDDWVRDLETVTNAAQLERFPLIGISQGGAVAIAYAIRHPEQVSHLILYGSYARGRFKREPGGGQSEEEQALAQLVRLGWGKDNPAFRQVFTTLFIPDGTPEQHQWFNDLERISTSPENAVKFLKTMGMIDIEKLLPKVRVPTLVLHAEHDARVPFAEGRLIASRIPGAHFVPLVGKNHIILEQERAWPDFVTAVRGFLNAD